MNLAAEPQFPTKWPFPPAPPARRAWGRVLSPFRRARRNTMGAIVTSPVAPISPVARADHAFATSAAAMPVSALASAPIASAPIASPVVPGSVRDVTLRQMIVDILLVAMWGAMIPALMWLGTAAGF